MTTLMEVQADRRQAISLLRHFGLSIYSLRSHETTKGELRSRALAQTLLTRLLGRTPTEEEISEVVG